jgi:hypothetical protein
MLTLSADWSNRMAEPPIQLNEFAEIVTFFADTPLVKWIAYRGGSHAPGVVSNPPITLPVTVRLWPPASIWMIAFPVPFSITFPEMVEFVRLPLKSRRPMSSRLLLITAPRKLPSGAPLNTIASKFEWKWLSVISHLRRP